MIDERHEELAALHALDLLEGAEKTAFEAELARDPARRALVDDLRASSASLALAARQVEPPASLKQRIAAALEHEAAPDASSAPATLLPFPVASVLPWGIAACFALAAAFFGLRTVSLRSETAALQAERDLARIACEMAQAQLGERTVLAEKMISDLGRRLQRTEDLSRLKIAALASLLGNTPEAKAIAVWDPDQQSGLLTVEKLPAVAAEQDYQLWVVDPQYPNPVDGGVFKPDSTGRATLTFKTDKPVQQASAFAISLEKKGGVRKAEGPLVLLGRL